MKPGIVNILLMISFIASIAISGVKLSNSQTDIDKIRKGLEGVRSHIIPGSTLLLDWDRQCPDMIFKSRFALAPVPIRLDSIRGQDTVLSIHAHRPGNEEPDHTGKKIIWQHRDDTWDYNLITSE